MIILFYLFLTGKFSVSVLFSVRKIVKYSIFGMNIG